MRRVVAVLAGVLVSLATAAQPAADEAGARAALARCVEVWNRHDANAFYDACLTEDAWFSESDDSFYKRFRGRAAVLGAFSYHVVNSDLRWDVQQLRALPDGTVAARLAQQLGMLPRSQDRYAQVFASEPAFARLRRDGGAWKVFLFTSHKGWAQALWLELERPTQVAAATSKAAALPTVPGTEPAAYTQHYGSRSTSCFHCHGRRPVVSEDGDRGRIIAAGAEADSAAALRRAMTTPRAGQVMDDLLADPALDDTQLDAIRAWLRALRDGRAERSGQRLVIHNDRSPRDPPARLVLLRAVGGWKLQGGKGCRQGLRLMGGTQCEITLPAGARGALEFRFAPSPGLESQAVRVAIDAEGRS